MVPDDTATRLVHIPSSYMRYRRLRIFDRCVPLLTSVPILTSESICCDLLLCWCYNVKNWSASKVSLDARIHANKCLHVKHHVQHVHIFPVLVNFHAVVCIVDCYTFLNKNHTLFLTLHLVTFSQLFLHTAAHYF